MKYVRSLGGNPSSALFVMKVTLNLLTSLPPRWPSDRHGFDSRFRLADFFPGRVKPKDSKIGTPVATLPGDWRYRASAGTGRPGVRILGLGEIENFICYFCLSVAACKISVRIRA